MQMEIGESISFKFLHLFAADNKIQELERNLNCSQSSKSCKLPAQIAQNSKTNPFNSLCFQSIKKTRVVESKSLITRKGGFDFAIILLAY